MDFGLGAAKSPFEDWKRGGLRKGNYGRGRRQFLLSADNTQTMGRFALRRFMITKLDLAWVYLLILHQIGRHNAAIFLRIRLYHCSTGILFFKKETDCCCFHCTAVSQSRKKKESSLSPR